MRVGSEDLGELSRLLQRAQEGDQSAEESLIELVYDELRRRANAMVGPGAGSLRGTQLVHDVWERVFHGGKLDQLNRRSEFFRYASRVMRNLVIDHVRKANKRPKDAKRVPLDDVVADYRRVARVDLLDLEDALERLRAEHPRQCQVVELRFFTGLKMQDIAEALEVGISTVESDWRAARARLYRSLSDKIQT